MKFTTTIAMALLLSATNAFAQPTAYLPLGIDAHLESQLDRMFVITRGTPMHKPYALSEVDIALAALKNKDQALYNYLTDELKRYRGEAKISRYGVRATLSSGEDMHIGNQRGLSTDEYGQAFFEGVWRPNDYMLAQVGVDYRFNGQDLVAYNTLLSFAAANVQLDLGYKDHWYSPFKNAAQIMSNNAQMPASVSLSTVEPISSWWNADFEMFYTQLDEVKEGIYYQEQWHDGSPELLGFHASIEPIQGWKLGFNRALQMGGGPRETDISDIFKGFFNPAGKDNTNEDLNRDEELGDQLMSITSTVYFNWQMPAEIYLEYAAEDTNDHSNFKFGNESMSLGIYLPKMSDNSSLRYEVNKWNTAWYTNHLYKYGNTNKGFVFGHYGADDRNFGDAVPAIVQTINYHYFDSALSSWQLKASTQKNDRAEYSRAYSLSIMNSQKVGNFRLESSLTGGKNSFEEDFAYLSVSLLW